MESARLAEPSPRDAGIGPAPPGCTEATDYFTLRATAPLHVATWPNCLWWVTVVPMVPPAQVGGVARILVNDEPLLEIDLARLEQDGFPGAGSGEFDFEFDPVLLRPGDRLALDLRDCFRGCSELYVLVAVIPPGGG